MIIASISILAYIITGALGYATAFADVQRINPAVAKRDRSQDRQFALIVGILGPIGFLCGFLCTRYNGRPFRYGLLWIADPDPVEEIEEVIIPDCLDIHKMLAAIATFRDQK